MGIVHGHIPPNQIRSGRPDLQQASAVVEQHRRLEVERPHDVLEGDLIHLRATKQAFRLRSLPRGEIFHEARAKDAVNAARVSNRSDNARRASTSFWRIIPPKPSSNATSNRHIFATTHPCPNRPLGRGRATLIIRAYRPQ